MAAVVAGATDRGWSAGGVPTSPGTPSAPAGEGSFPALVARGILESVGQQVDGLPDPAGPPVPGAGEGLGLLLDLSQLAPGGALLQVHHLGVQPAAGALLEVEAGESALALAELPFEDAEQRQLLVAVHLGPPPALGAGVPGRRAGQSEAGPSTGPLGVPVAPPGGVVGATRTSRGSRWCAGT